MGFSKAARIKTLLVIDTVFFLIELIWWVIILQEQLVATDQPMSTFEAAIPLAHWR